MDAMALERVKTACGLSDEEFNGELSDLICSACIDLNIAGVDNVDTKDMLTMTAIKTYCNLHFGESSNPEFLKKTYDELKASMSMSSRYTTWTNRQ